MQRLCFAPPLGLFQLAVQLLDPIADFVFFINGQYMEHNALAIQQKGSSLELHVHTGSIGYILESDDEILSIGKFNS